METIIGRFLTPLNSSRTMGSVRRRDDNSRGKVQNVRGDSSARCRELIGSSASITTPVAASPATDYRDRTEALTGLSMRTCPACHHGKMIVIKRLLPVPQTA